MNLRRRGLFALPVLGFAGRAAAQTLKIPEQWYGVEVEDNVFTVQMPGIPDHRIVNDATARGTRFQLHSYSLDADGFSYVAQSALYPADVDANPRAILQAALGGRAQSLAGGTWTRVDWRDIQGGMAVESVGPLRGGNALRQLVLLKGRRFVSLAFLGNVAAVNGADANRFFTSLKLQA